jgi:hypothetical protein
VSGAALIDEVRKMPSDAVSFDLASREVRAMNAASTPSMTQEYHTYLTDSFRHSKRNIQAHTISKMTPTTFPFFAVRSPEISGLALRMLETKW